MRQIFPILIVLFLGYLGFSFALPLFPPMFLDTTRSILPVETSPQMRAILLGILLGTYPLGQFIGSPILGKYSDKYGRKRVLILSLLAIIPSYLISAVAIHFRFIPLLFISRFVCGLFEGNVTIAQAALADRSKDTKEKTKNFGFATTFISLGFILGPLLGGELANTEHVSWFKFETPFYAAALLIFCSLMYVTFKYKEVKHARPEMTIKPQQITSDYIKGLTLPNLRKIYLSNFFLFIGVMFFFGFISLYLVDIFQFNVSQLAQANAYLAIPIAFAPLLFRRIAKSLSPIKWTLISSFCLAISLIIVILPNSPYALFFTLLPTGFFIASGFTYTALMVSEEVAEDRQGHALGINQSLQMLAEASTGFIGGSLAAIIPSLPIMVGAGFAILSAFFLLFRLKR